MRVTVGPCTLSAETFEFAIVGIETAVTAMKCALLHPIPSYDKSVAITPRPDTVARSLCKFAIQMDDTVGGYREADVIKV